MAILPTNLGSRFETDIELGQDDVLVYHYEIYHKSWSPDTVIESGSLSQRVANMSQFDSADTALQLRLGSQLREVQSVHKAIPSLGYSLFDVDLIWQNWTFTVLASGKLQASHPLSGEFTGAVDNTPLGRTGGLLSVVLGPPAWAWADSPGAGQVRTKTLAVPGADHYNVYHDLGGAFELLGSVPNAGLNTLSNIDAGTYSVRLAAVSGSGRVGILSVAMPLTIA